MDTPNRRMQMMHTQYWLNVYLRMVRTTTQPQLKRAALVRLRHFQRQAQRLLAGERLE